MNSLETVLDEKLMEKMEQEQEQSIDEQEPITEKTNAPERTETQPEQKIDKKPVEVSTEDKITSPPSPKRKYTRKKKSVDIQVEPVTVPEQELMKKDVSIQADTEIVDIVDEEGTYHICRMVFGMIFPNTPPEIPDEQIRTFARELYIYCELKGINIRDFLFDEIGLVATLVPIASLTIQKYNNYRNIKLEEKRKRESILEKSSILEKPKEERHENRDST